jgi:hypothetical protein
VTSRRGRPSTGGSGGGAQTVPSRGSTRRYASVCGPAQAGTRSRARASPTPSRSRPLGRAEKSVVTMVARRSAAESGTSWWTPRGLGAQSQGAQREGARPGRAEAPTAVGTDRALAPQAPVAGRRIRRQGQEMGQGGDGLSVEIVRKPQKPVPEEVAKVGAEEWAKEGKKVDWQRLMPPRGYVALPRRRVVERTFSWLGQNRRTSLGTTRGCARARKRSSTRP